MTQVLAYWVAESMIQAAKVMPIFTLSGSRTPPPPSPSSAPATSESRTVAVVGIAVVVILAAIAIGAITYVRSFAAKFKTLDDSQSSFSATETQTVYTNPKYGVTLKLPGKWRRVRPPFKSFCTLASSSGMSAMFWPIFPAPGANVDQDAQIIAQGYTRQGRWTMESDSVVEVNGRRGRKMRFQTNFAGQELEMVVVKKWPVLYALAITAPRDSDDWSEIEDALPQSMEVK